MPPAARIGDMHTCPMVTPGVPPIPHVGGPVIVGCPTVMIGFMPAARVTDTCICVGPPDTIAKGSMTVFIGGMPAARIGDLTMHGGVIVMGCPTVMIGDVGQCALASAEVPLEVLSYLADAPRYIRAGIAAAQAANYGQAVGKAVGKAMERAWDAKRGGLSAAGQWADRLGTAVSIAKVGVSMGTAAWQHQNLWQSGERGNRGEFVGRVGYAGARGVAGALGAGLGAKGGAIAGAKVGALIGSAVAPGAGTVVGAAAGAVVGAVLGGMAGEAIAENVVDGAVGEERAAGWGRGLAEKGGGNTERAPP